MQALKIISLLVGVLFGLFIICHYLYGVNKEKKDRINRIKNNIKHWNNEKDE